MRCLVTGGTALIGSRVVRDLVKGGDPVVAYDIRPDEEVIDMLLSKKEKSKVELVQGDILDFDKLTRTCKDNKVDTIIHMAYIMASETKADPRGNWWFFGVELTVATIVLLSLYPCPFAPLCL